MSDETVAALLRSDEPLVVIEAPAGCGKTFQGAGYAREIAGAFGAGRLLILTHTHAACGVFAERTAGAGNRVEIRTIDALIAQVATTYHRALDLPANPSAWAYQNGGEGFGIMASRVAALLHAQPMIPQALARRYPVIICDEHQDSTLDQHAVVMSLHQAGAMLRIFGDPWQRIFGRKSDAAARADRVRWDALKAQGASASLDYPHRWDTGCPELGRWVLCARQSLEEGRPIDLTANVPASLRVLAGTNTASSRTFYRLSDQQGRSVRQAAQRPGQTMILANNSLVRPLSAFWNRSIPIWEGHTREALASLVTRMREAQGNREALAEGMIEFVGSIASGFSESSHGRLLLREVREGCTRTTGGKPGSIRTVARCIVDDASHTGVAAALCTIRKLVEERANGFEEVRVDHPAEFREAIRLGDFTSADEGYSAIARQRPHRRPAPPSRVLCSIHKAKGLECDNAVVMACDRAGFSGTIYSRCKLYVALSRARTSLTLVLPETGSSPLFRVE